MKGPISRAQLDANGRDQGEFIDSDGDRWDVKSSPDVKPSYKRGAGDPLPFPQNDDEFTEMIQKDLSTGEKILVDPDGMTPARQSQLKQLTENNPQWQGRVIWGR